MSHVSYQTAIALKEAGMSQPTPKAWQLVWAYEDLCVVSMVYQDGEIDLIRPMMRDIRFTQDQFIRLATLAPDLEYITTHLPPGFILEMWDGRHSCKIETDETTIRTQADNFAEAAALVYLSLKQNAPGQTFVQPGDVAQE